MAEPMPPPPPVVPVRPGPAFVTADLSSNRFNALPRDTAQLTAYYDGDPAAQPTLRLQCRDAGGRLAWFSIERLPHSSPVGEGRVATAQYTMRGCVPTGVVDVSGVAPDGVIDGVAFGLLYRDAAGRMHQLRSQSPDGAQTTAVGMWPLQISDAQFTRITPQISDPIARAQSKAALFGAEYMGNGRHQLSLPASWARVNQPLAVTRPPTIVPPVIERRCIPPAS